MADRGGTATIVHEGLPIGGCCLHVGCVPSKYLIRAAEQLHRMRESTFPGIKPGGAKVDQKALFDDLRKRVREMRERNYEKPLPENPRIRLIRGWGRLAGPASVKVNGETVEGDAVLVATGSRTDPARAEELSPERVLTNENFFDQDRLPESVVVIGGGYIAVEMMQMMNRMGVRVTALQRSGHILSSQPEYLGGALGDFLKMEGVNLIRGAEVKALRETGEGVTARALVDGVEQAFSAEKVFMARGRLGNTGEVGLRKQGIQTDHRGFVHVDGELRTACPTVYAAGDVLGGHMLVYTASAEAERVVAHLYGEAAPGWDPASVPWVVFSDPQAAGVGCSAEEARGRGLEVEEAELPVDRWPRFSAMRETRGFLRLFRDPATDTLVGARALCPEAGDLMSELSLILRHRIPLKEVAGALVPYLTLNEGIQRCASRFY